MARLDKRKLDEKQYIEYEMIACTFLLGLVHDGNDPNTTLYSCLGHTMGSTATLNINNIVHRLEASGEQSQLIMFLTGTADSGMLDSGSQSLTIHGVRGIRRRVRA